MEAKNKSPSTKVSISGQHLYMVEMLRAHYRYRTLRRTILSAITAQYNALPAIAKIPDTVSMIESPGLDTMATGSHLIQVSLEADVARQWGHLLAITLARDDSSLLSHLIKIAHRAMVQKHHRLRRISEKSL